MVRVQSSMQCGRCVNDLRIKAFHAQGLSYTSLDIEPNAGVNQSCVMFSCRLLATNSYIERMPLSANLDIFSSCSFRVVGAF